MANLLFADRAPLHEKQAMSTGRHPPIRGWLAFVFLAAATAAFAGDVAPRADEWKKALVTADGVTVKARKPARSSLHELRASCTVDAPPERVFEVAMQRDSYDNSTKHVAEYRVVARDGENVWFTYERLAFPVIRDRDYTLRYETRRNAAKRQLAIIWTLANDRGPSPRKRVVRVLATHGTLEMFPEADGRKTLLVCTLYADPGGWIPHWLVESVNRQTIPDLMRLLRKKAEEAAARGTADAENREGGAPD